MNEIGSEFELELLNNKGKGLQEILPDCSDSKLVFCGRTALELVLDDIGCKCKKALLPSYCCDSMIEPFRVAGIEVSFYDVSFNQGFCIDIKIPDDCDIVLWNNYFGFNIGYPEKIFSEFSGRGGIVIEDITHSLFSHNQYGSESHYLVASLRKWGALLSGGFAAKKTGLFNCKEFVHPADEFIDSKLAAMKKKSDYISKTSDERTEENKSEFLKLFSDSNHFFADEYHKTSIDSISEKWLSQWNVDFIRKTRIKNAKVLYKGLSESEFVKPVFAIDDMDCPLFVPIAVESSKRDYVVKKLAENGIYCPRHWPHPKADCESDLYNTEISLICDQRYNSQDMERIVSVILNEV